MGFFGPTPPKRITESEFKLLMSKLYSKLDEKERFEVEKLFRGDLYEPSIDAGISQVEFDSAVTWLRENMKKHVLEESDIEYLESRAEQYLKN
jgi:hypothetical protein